MKKLVILSSLLSLALGSAAYADSANGTAKVRIVTPIAITAGADLQFGSIGASGSAGTVAITTAGAATPGGGATLISTGGAARTAGTFSVTGESNATYTISLPSSASLTSGSDTITVNGFVSNPLTTGALSAGGSQTINIGGTLQVGANQAAGAYIGTYPVTVAYN